MPAGHVLHANTAPDSFQNLPRQHVSPHASADADFSLGVVLPAGQASHNRLSSPAENFPDGQFSHKRPDGSGSNVP